MEVSSNQPDLSRYAPLIATYDRRKLIQGSDYMLHVARAYDYAQSIFSGLDADVRNAISDLDIFRQMCDPKPRYHDSVNINDHRRSLVREIWRLYENELAEIMQLNRPTKQIYQLFSTIHAQVLRTIAGWLVETKYQKKVHLTLAHRKQRRQAFNFAIVQSPFSEEPRFHNVANLIEKLFEVQLLNEIHMSQVVQQCTIYLRQWAAENKADSRWGEVFRLQVDEVIKY
jgi:hypothetical protein